MKRLWRITRSILRCPLTPVVLAVLLAWDAYLLAIAAKTYQNSTVVGRWLERQIVVPPWQSISGSSLRRWDGRIVSDPHSGLELRLGWGHSQIGGTRPRPTVVADLGLHGSGQRLGIYAPTTHTRMASISITYEDPQPRTVMESFLDEYAAQALDAQNRGVRMSVEPRELQRLNEMTSTIRHRTSPNHPTKIILSREINETRTLPSGYIHNTLAAAALLAFLISAPWSLATIPGRVRRWRWKRADACIHCGYDTTALPDAPRCPECGNAKIPSPREG